LVKDRLAYSQDARMDSDGKYIKIRGSAQGCAFYSQKPKFELFTPFPIDRIKKRSCRGGTARRSKSVEILSTAARLYEQVSAAAEGPRDALRYARSVKVLTTHVDTHCSCIKVVST